MTRSYIQFLAILLLTSASVHGQKSAPKYLAESSYCLVSGTQDRLAPQESDKADLTLGYWLDSKSRPHEKHLIVAVFADPQEGKVFDFWMTRQHGHKIYILEKDAEFVREDTGVRFVRPALGGPWSNVHLELAVKRIEKRRRFSLSVEELLDQRSEIQCSSYLDSK